MGELIDSAALYETVLPRCMPRTAKCTKIPGHDLSGSVGNMGNYRLCLRNRGWKLGLSGDAIGWIESHPTILRIVASHFHKVQFDS